MINRLWPDRRTLATVVLAQAGAAGHDHAYGPRGADGPGETKEERMTHAAGHRRRGPACDFDSARSRSRTS